MNTVKVSRNRPARNLEGGSWWPNLEPEKETL
jgi:hypothetical protein